MIIPDPYEAPYDMPLKTAKWSDPYESGIKDLTQNSWFINYPYSAIA